MREIKFRAWSKYQDFMFPWKDIYLGGSETTLKEVHDGLKSSGYILMQYTGLHDKSGKEIYEKDFILAEISGEFEDRGTSKTFVVEYEGYGFSPFISLSPEGYHLYPTYTVLGNVYETPELLKGTK